MGQDARQFGLDARLIGVGGQLVTFVFYDAVAVNRGNDPLASRG